MARNMIHHITLLVNDLKISKRFYTRVCEPLGYRLLREKSHSACFGKSDTDGERDFWIRSGAKMRATHSFSCLAFTAHSKYAVDEFHKAALTAGGADNGAPGYRKYRSNYYAAYVLDPDGHNIEAVFDDAERPR